MGASPFASHLLVETEIIVTVAFHDIPEIHLRCRKHIILQVKQNAVLRIIDETMSNQSMTVARHNLY
jgi:hypothetical protein